MSQPKAEPQTQARARVRTVVIGHTSGGQGGGQGASTLCLVIAAALKAQGQKVATIDCAGDQALTRALAARECSLAEAGLAERPAAHRALPSGDGEAALDALGEAVAALGRGHDFIMLDTWGAGAAITRMAYALADTLVLPFTPWDLDLALDPSADTDLFDAGSLSSIGSIVREARRERRARDLGEIDWIVLRNRVPARQGFRLPARTADLVSRAAMEFGYRTLDGLGDRPAHRTALATGLTIFDRDDELAPVAEPGLAAISSALEAWTMVEALRLPLDPTARRRAALHAEWAAARRTPLELDPMLGPEG
ncbi:hypothetical protein J0H33_08505 [bacterium]|nr:hypothetical protein [bacterium]